MTYRSYSHPLSPQCTTPMADLITTARAKYNLNNLSTTADEDTTLAALVTACSQAVRRYCRRDFDSRQYDELYNGTDHLRLPLRQFPIISVARVPGLPSERLWLLLKTALCYRAGRI